MIQLFKYRPLLQVELPHAYYRNGFSPDFEIVPSPECKRNLANFGLYFKPGPHGFTLAGQVRENAETGTLQLWKNFGKGTHFTFLMYLKNPLFSNFTDLPFTNPAEKIYYFSNQNKSNENLYLLENAALGQVGPEDQVLLKSGILKIEYGSTNTSLDVAISQLNGSFSETQVGDDDNLVVTRDLRDYPPGRYDLTIEGQLFKCYYAPDEVYRQKIFGIIEIFTHSDVDESYRFFNDAKEIQFKKYQIPFANRATWWRYHLIDKYENEFENLGIIQEDLPLKFSQADSLYVSEEAIPLKEEPYPNINLKREFDAEDPGSGEIIRTLPNPKVNLIKPEASEDSEELKIYSDIFIYI